ncbi:fimbria/pilus outer membrane usher protein [Xenorhabdus bovienii]
MTGTTSGISEFPLPRMTALLVNYYYSGSTNWQAWRLRNYSTYTSQHKNWRSIKSYLQRDIHAFKGQLIVGDSFTLSYFFDGIEFRGIQLASDENMLPDTMKGFAPVVSGFAQSHAQVTIKQNGYVIYQTYVAHYSIPFKAHYIQTGSVITASRANAIAKVSIIYN